MRGTDTVTMEHAPRRIGRRVGALILCGALAASGVSAAAVLASAPPAEAVPGSPATPAAPVTLFHESFENGLDDGVAVRLPDYVGETGATYTADPDWINVSQGNGIVADGLTTPGAFAAIGFNNSGGSGALAGLATALGALNGTAPANQNHAVTAWTATAAPAAGSDAFRTQAQLTLPVQDRFINFSVNAAATSCGSANPQLGFFVEDGADEIPMNSAPLNPCGMPGNSGQLIGDTSVLFDSEQLGIIMRNGQTSAGGNDYAFDDIRVLDTTPQLDQAFTESSIVAGQKTTLRYTVTNTSELGEKHGWGFTGALPTGVRFTSATPVATCDADVDVDADTGTVTVTAGKLDVGDVSCTIEIEVTAPAAGTFTAADAITAERGIDLPNPLSLTVIERVGPPADCSAGVSLVNGGFESPALSGSGGNQMMPQAEMPGWSTNDINGVIEIWQSGFNGVPAAEGDQFVELNAYSAGTLYQDVATTPGQTITWSLQHRARVGSDTMRVVIGDPAVPLADLPQSGSDITNGTTAWGSHTGSYLVPPGQTTTRFGFQAVSAGSNNIAMGNFLDNVEFGTGPCLQAAKTVEKLTRTSDPEVTVGDRLRYTVAATNNGSGTAVEVVSRDRVPAGAEFVPGSIHIAGAAVTDAEGDDTGEFASGDVIARLGSGANATDGGSLARGATVSYSFEVVITEATAGDAMRNTAQFGFTDPISGEERSTATNETSTPIIGHPALTLAKSSTPAVAAAYRAGQRIVYSFAVQNTGNVTVAGVSIVESSFTGTGDLSPVTCAAGAAALAPGQTATCEASYVLTQADIDAGGVSNTAIAVGAFGGSPVESDGSTSSLTAKPAPGLELVKTADAERISRVGQTITYSFTLTNTGNVSLTEPMVDEREFSGEGRLGEVVCPAVPAPLAPGASVVCTAAYDTVASDLTGAPLSNTATAVAQAPDGEPVAAEASTVEVATQVLAKPRAPGAGEPLAFTGAVPTARTAGIATALLALGAGALALRGRRRRA